MMWWIICGVLYLMVVFFTYSLVRAAGRNRNEMQDRDEEMRALRHYRLTGRW